MRCLTTDDIAHLEYELSLAPSRPELLLMLEAIATSRLANEGPFDGYLDQLTLRALALAPSLPTVKGTRGAVLASLGRHEEALALLAQADESNDFNRALNAAFRALAQFHAQRPDEAHAEMGIAINLFRSPMHMNETGRCIIERICREIGFQLPGADILV